MLDLSFIRNNIGLVKQKIEQRHTSVPLQELEQHDRQWRNLLQKTEQLRHKKNKNNNEIMLLRKQKKDTTKKIDAMKEISKQIKQLDKKLRSCEEKLQALQLMIPNIPHDTVPVGINASDNNEISIHGEKPQFNFKPKPHWDLGLKLGILDLNRATKITGARFSLYAGLGAKLERALINFMLDIHTQEFGYLEVLPPFMVNSNSLKGTGQLPKFSKDLFQIEGTDYWLVPTAEVPVTNIFSGETLKEDKLPIQLVASTPCFRSEAGAHGKDTRGLIRQHQFNKVELVKFTKPEDSYKELNSLTHCAEEILRRLNLHYRVVSLCTGDLGFSSAKTYDIEVWLPGQKSFREISSCSNFEDFQARRANIRFHRTTSTKPELVHTLNGSGLAIGRTWVAIIENYQQKDGSILIPKVLRPYLNGENKILPGQRGLG